MSVAIRRLTAATPGFDAALARAARLCRPRPTREIEASVAAILADVRARGDAAVLEYTRRFDGIDAALGRGARGRRGRAARRARAHCRRRSARARSRGAARCATSTSASSRRCGRSWSYRDDDGTLLGQKVTPLDRVGIYVPGGKAAYPSSVLMNAMPAKVAGVGEIVMVAPMPARRAQPAGARRGRASPASTGCSRSAARRRSARSPTARRRSRRCTRSPARATPTSPAPSGASSARSAST